MKKKLRPGYGPVIKNSKGEVVTLTPFEQKRAEYWQRVTNDLGYEINITTLTTITKSIVTQKFFEVAPADYLPVRVGQGTWSTNLTTYREFGIASQFEEGILNNGGQNSRLATADAGVDSLNIKVYPWGKSISWNIFELQQAAKAGNWDLVTAKERARKKDWDLGVQRVAFLGARGLNAVGGTCLGLLNQSGITENTTVITKAISSMTPAELKTFQKTVLEAYRENCKRTAWPTHFIIPESDYNGLASQASADFPIKSTLQLLEEAFQTTTGNKSFKILPLSYADVDYHADVDGIDDKQVYTLLRYDEDSLRMDIPLDYTNTLANSFDSFNYQNVGYGQFTGALAYRPLEMLYFTYVPS
jgi:hypothetical protein